MSQGQYYAQVAQREEWEREYADYCAAQEALPAHKRVGWLEMMADNADQIRKANRENFNGNSNS